MIKTCWRWFAPAALCIATLAVPAQTSKPAAAARPDPLDASAGVPRLVYRSSLMPAQPVPAGTPSTWREANDTVTRIGGWRAYAREAQAPAQTSRAAPAAPASAAAMPAQPAAKPTATPQGHSGHKMP